MLRFPFGICGIPYDSALAKSTERCHFPQEFAEIVDMGLTDREKEWGNRASRFLKAELKRAGIGYKELAERLTAHGMEETETSIAGKLSRASFGAAFFLACLSVLELEGMQISQL